MSRPPQLLWVNKNAKSKSLSNSRADEEESIINSHAQTVTQQKNRQQRSRALARRPLKPTQLVSKPVTSPSTFVYKHANSVQEPSADNQNIENSEQNLDQFFLQKYHTYQQKYRLLVRTDVDQFRNPSSIPTIPTGTSHIDPFSSFVVNLDAATLRHLRYFESVWYRAAFQCPVQEYLRNGTNHNEVFEIISNCLRDELSLYCLLAAVSRRKSVVHNVANEPGELSAEQYAARALHILRQRLQKDLAVTDQSALDILFLSAYELYCGNHNGTRRHLMALSMLHKGDFESQYVRSLWQNIDMFVATATLSQPTYMPSSQHQGLENLKHKFDHIRRSSLHNVIGSGFPSHLNIFNPQLLRTIQEIVQCARVAEDCYQHLALMQSEDRPTELHALVSQLAMWTDELSYQVVQDLGATEDYPNKSREQTICECAVIVLLMWLSYLPVRMMSLAGPSSPSVEDNRKMIQGRGTRLVQGLKSLNIFDTMHQNPGDSPLIFWMLIAGIVMAVDYDDVEYCCRTFIRMAAEMGIIAYEQMCLISVRYLCMHLFERVDWATMENLFELETQEDAVREIVAQAYAVEGAKNTPTRITDRASNRYRMGA